ncbi:hypothetical protein CCMA1212_008094 [Trichoderma ghanense]|uniref:Uncharacterized protein n=1 Tax=Trichoderma ghanense TaxID=65468 RepID=A0ABY2GWK4_9HYPO
MDSPLELMGLKTAIAELRKLLLVDHSPLHIKARVRGPDNGPSASHARFLLAPFFIQAAEPKERANSSRLNEAGQPYPGKGGRSLPRYRHGGPRLSSKSNPDILAVGLYEIGLEYDAAVCRRLILWILYLDIGVAGRCERKLGWLAQARTRAVPERRIFLQATAIDEPRLRAGGAQSALENRRECPRLLWLFRHGSMIRTILAGLSVHSRGGSAARTGALEKQQVDRFTGIAAGFLAVGGNSELRLSVPASNIDLLGTNSTRSFYVTRQSSG